MSDYDDYEERRGPGSRISVFLVGLLIGALIMTGVWVGVAGNPLSDVNEVQYFDITVASVNLEKNTMCWSEDPGRRDAGQVCAILALDRADEVPMPGTDVTVGTVELGPPGQEATRHAVYVSGRGGGGGDQSESEPEPSPSE